MLKTWCYDSGTHEHKRHREILHAQNDQLITDRRSITAPEDPHTNDA